MNNRVLFLNSHNQGEKVRLHLKIQKNYNYPTILSATVGKNMPERTIRVAKILKGWTMGASIQSTDHGVLKAVKRSNISKTAYQKLINFGNKVKIETLYVFLIFFFNRLSEL